MIKGMLAFESGSLGAIFSTSFSGINLLIGGYPIFSLSVGFIVFR
jgi:hypothetical protein